MNVVYIATSLDGMIADRDGSVDWLNQAGDPDGGDNGFGDFMEGIDALVMGRTTYETVLGFGIDWPYTKPVFVLSSTLTDVPEDLAGKVTFLKGAPADIQQALQAKGYRALYIDGGRVIQSFLAAGLIDRLILTRVPVLLGGGVPLFADLDRPQTFTHVDTTVLPGGMVQSTYDRTAA